MTTSSTTTTEHGIAGALTYWTAIVGTYVLLGMTMFKSGWGKLFEDDGTAPAALAEQFSTTFIDTFPGVDAAWVILGILELLVCLLLLVSIVRGEFLTTRSKGWLKAATGVSLLTFACLALGQTSLGNHEGTASLYTYFGSTAVIMLLVDWLERARG